MKRRRWLQAGCAQCLLLASARAADIDGYVMPPRFTRPDVASDEGGLWALMDREEVRLRRSPFRMRDEGLQDYLQALACKLGSVHCPDIRVYPLRTPYFNASMAPNGMMQVWSGLLLRVENEAQLAAVMAHELGHFLQRHTLERLRDIKARSAFGTFMSVFGVAGALAQLATLASAFAFSRDQERQADEIGLVLMEAAGYDPREAAKIWDNLIAEMAAGGDADPQKSSPMFATHPASAERSRDLATRAAGRSGALGEADYAARLRPLRFTLLADDLQRKRHAETLVLLDRMLARQPADAELLYFRGESRRLRAQAGDAEGALADFEAAVATGQAPAPTHRSLGYVQRSLGNAPAARRAFERYLQLAPAAPDAALIRLYLSEEGKPP